jgi:WD40 repeat protein
MYWNLHNNEVLFSFLGHSDVITDISMSPINDYFLTTSGDKTSRLWDLDKRKCLCILQESNHAVFDDTGKVIASVTYANEKGEKIINYINLYATENILQGPFKVFKIESGNGNDINIKEIKELKFSNDGAYIICTTVEDCILIIDSFDGKILKKLQAEINETESYFKVDVSPDSKYVVSGSDSGQIHIWNISSGELITSLDCHPQASHYVKFSPKHCLLASSCKNLVLWHPDFNLKDNNNSY